MNLYWRQVVLYITTLGMEGCWLYALLSLLNRQVADSRLSALGILLLYPLAFVFNILLRQLRWHRFARKGLSWMAWALGMLLIVKMQLFSDLPLSDPAWLLSIPRSVVAVIHIFKPELLILISTAVLWWLGERVASIGRNFVIMVTEFQFGLPILVITFFSASQLKVAVDNPVAIGLAFFLFALVGISVAHASEGTSWLSGLYRGHWSGLLLISISLVLVLGLIISQMVTPNFLQSVWAAIKWAWGLVMKLITFLDSLLPQPGPIETPSAMPSMPEMGAGNEPAIFTLPELFRKVLTIGLTVIFAGVILLVLWRIASDVFRWLRRKLAGAAGAEFEPLPGAFRADLLAWLKRILSRLLRLRLRFRLRARPKPLPPGIASVRQIYRQLLRWAAARGYPRQTSQTPHEYYYALAHLLPAAQDDLDLITQQYARTRYGALPLTEDELHQLSQCWYRVRQNRLKRKRRLFGIGGEP